MEEISEESLNLITKISVAVGSSEAAVRLLLSILLGYPIGLIHRYYLYGKSPDLQHIYFIICGFALGYFNFGLDIFIPVLVVCFVYGVLKAASGKMISVIITFVFTMTVLLYGYYKTAKETYVINWTMPQCVLTLRLIGIAMDLFDGSQPPETLSASSKKVALKEMPSILEIFAHVFFPGSVLVGPQFPMKRYQDFVAGKFSTQGSLPDCLSAAGRRAVIGVFYLCLFQVGYIYFSDDYLLSETFQKKNLISRWFFMGIWGHVALYKYVCIWLICESVCICTGITYNGLDSDRKPKWDGCANINLKVFEGATNFGHYVESFNINTNQWVLQYIYKRLKFLGNKYLSQIGVLIFLAVWHGFYSGYYMCFFMEFICLVMEKDLASILQKNKVFLEFLSYPGIKQLTWVFLKLYTLIFMGYCMAPFVLLSVYSWLEVYINVCFIGHIVWLGWHCYGRLVKKLFPPQVEHEKSS